MLTLLDIQPVVAYAAVWGFDGTPLGIRGAVETPEVENWDVESRSAEDSGRCASRRALGTVVEDSVEGSTGDLNKSVYCPCCLDSRCVDPSRRAKRSKARFGVSQPLNEARW